MQWKRENPLIAFAKPLKEIVINHSLTVRRLKYSMIFMLLEANADPNAKVDIYRNEPVLAACLARLIDFTPEHPRGIHFFKPHVYELEKNEETVYQFFDKFFSQGADPYVTIGHHGWMPIPRKLLGEAIKLFLCPERCAELESKILAFMATKPVTMAAFRAYETQTSSKCSLIACKAGRGQQISLKKQRIILLSLSL